MIIDIFKQAHKISGANYILCLVEKKCVFLLQRSVYSSSICSMHQQRYFYIESINKK